jgi:hypothetical protein
MPKTRTTLCFEKRASPVIIVVSVVLMTLDHAPTGTRSNPGNP